MRIFQLGSLQVLENLSHHKEVQKEMTELAAVELLVELLKSPETQLQSLAANTLANLAQISKARTLVRKSQGIPILVLF